MLTGDTLSENAARLCEMPKGEKFPAVKSKKDDAENLVWVRSLHSSRRTGRPSTWRREAVIANQI